MLIYLLSRSESLYTTKRIFQAGINGKHNIRVINYMECDLLVEHGEYKVIYENEELITPDFVIPRIGSSVTFYGCTVVRHFQMMGSKVLNKPEGILNSRDKFRSLQLMVQGGIPIPKTFFSNDLYYAEQMVKDHLGYPFIMKVLEGTQGQGVFLVKNEQEAEALIDEHVSKKTRVILQEFISEFSGKDIRVIVVYGKVVATMMRQAKEGDFRSNIHAGGRGLIVELTAEEEQIAINSLSVLGLDMGGVDILRSDKGPMVIEVNSSPGFEGIEGVTKIPVAEMMMESIEQNF
ncbi:RimK family alpha-L-glutamate ligase [Paracrocinitomix mangrovi]|uniref:ATP-grasp domain-containing protein n=1 Tax=Paracrocinitomix mangrovi TaxID=2862509 RepID=UPI001C8D05C9|nr:RimK family alpha-L-glutamate ligase [Paracrocinitomix mangrovi]UKN01105.1 RimK family alpha-L-glutamate ligase [Paracrocinitomix mangrovi]